jgi:hypothetical protein
MFTRLLIAAGLATAIAHSPAEAKFTLEGKDRAVDACLTINAYAPAKPVATVEDGLGDWLVWVEDKDGDLWMCNANGEGAVFTNVMMQGDLLDGAGAEMIEAENVETSVNSAERLCAAVGSRIEEMQIVVTVEDGMGDYLVWLKNANEELWVCNASSEAELYDFQPVDMPLNEPVEFRYA